MSDKKRLFVRFSHYFTGTTISLLVGVISFPILTRVLTKEEYGILGLVSTTMWLIIALAKAGQSSAIMRFYKKYYEIDNQKEKFISTIFFNGFVLSLVCSTVYVALIPVIIATLGVDKKYTICFLIMSLFSFLNPLNTIIINLLRVRGQTIFLNIVEVFRKISSVTLSLLLLLVILKVFYGFFWGGVLTETLVAVILFRWFFKEFTVKINAFSIDISKKLLMFGIPMLLTETAYLLLSYADRYMLLGYYNADTLGLYTVGYNLSMYLADIVTFSLSYAVIPIYVELYEDGGRKKTEEFLSQALYFLITGIIPLVFGYYAVAGNLFTLLASDKYSSAANFAPIILVGTLFLGINNILNAGLYLKKKTKILFYIMISSVIVNIAMNLYFIPKYGPMGAALATLFSCLFATILVVLLSFKFIKINIIKTDKLLLHVLLSILMFVFVRQIIWSNLWVDLLLKVTSGILIIITGGLCIEKDLRHMLVDKIKSSKIYAKL